MIDFERPGRMISAGKRGPIGHLFVWNANVCLKSSGKIWFGDIDLTADSDELKQLARARGEAVYVLRESDARFMNEANPNYGNAVGIFYPDGAIDINEKRSYR